MGNIYPLFQYQNILIFPDRRKDRNTFTIPTHKMNTRADHLEHPVGIDLPSVTTDNTRYFDPSVIIQHDLLSSDGQILYAKGTRMNLLTTRNFTKRLIFIDGRNPTQLAWANTQFEQSNWRDKVMLTHGNPHDLTKAWGKRVYFDHHHALVDRFSITALPCLVYQEGSQIRIDEVALTPA